MNRYFLITVQIVGNNYKRYSTFTITTSDGSFPSMKWVCEFLKEEQVNILFLFEFKSQNDFSDYSKK